MPGQTVYMVSLGCPKNLVDSEYMIGLLSSAGFQIVGEIGGADIVIINTCGFIQDAVKESIETILNMSEAKQRGDINKLIVSGCLVQRYGYKLMREIPEVDTWMGTALFSQIVDIIREHKKKFFISAPLYAQDKNLPRLQSTPFYTAYVKISDGCSHKCSYCLIPRLRGPMRSIRPDIILSEIKELVVNGVKEINIVAQDITAYGKDLDKRMCLEDLIELILDIKEIEWIRLLYLHPMGISERLLRLIEHEERVCPYLDIPIQHVNDDILRLMGRDYNKKFLFQLMDRIRQCHRRIFLRTTIMVGFPGETEKMFEELYDFIKEVEFDHLGVFVFSPESGLYAAKLKDQVREEVARIRKDKLMSLQAEISKSKNKQMVGKTIPVLIEGYHPETELLLLGRSPWMAPDIDGQVIINKGYASIGAIVPVYILGSYTHDLLGEIL